MIFNINYILSNEYNDAVVPCNVSHVWKFGPWAYACLQGANGAQTARIMDCGFLLFLLFLWGFFFGAVGGPSLEGFKSSEPRVWLFVTLGALVTQYLEIHYDLCNK